MAKRFNEQFPNVAVQRIAGGNENLEKLITMLASDTRVDVIGTRPDYMASYVTGPNPFRNLRELMRRDAGTVKEADHADGVLDGLSFKGTLYALPVGVYTNNLCLNLDILAQQGVPVPKPGWTLDEAMEIARRTTVRRSEEDITWGFFQQWEVITHFPYSWIRGNGGEPFTPNEDVTTSRWATDTETLKTVQWLVDLAQKTGVTPVAGTGGTSGLFTQGKVAINVNETNNLYGIVTSQQGGGAQFKWTMHPLPRMAKGTYQPINAFAYGVSRNTKNADVSWELLKQMVGPAGQTDWYKLARFAPSIKSLLQGPYLQDPEPPTNKQVIVDAILASRAMPKSPRWVDINKVVVEVLAGLREGKVSVNAGLADIDRRVAAVLSQN
ncbi:MAG: extracellular solute-binding protein [Chloroflexota bacterium]|nr:extracellular solute-binding protein [Chloroflexota bacterium]